MRRTDLISKAEVLETYAELYDIFDDNAAIREELHKVYAKINSLKELEAAKQWISVKDRLPTESDGTVLICYPNEAPYNLMEPHPNAKHDQRVATGCYSQYSSTWYHGDMMGVGGADPIAWMPLPEPPKEET